MVTLALSILISAFSFATTIEPRFSSLKWKADDSLELVVQAAGSSVRFEGLVKEGGALFFSESGVDITLVAHSSSFLSLTLALTGAEAARLIILERQNSRYVVLAPSVVGPAVSLRGDYSQALIDLERRKNWDHSLAIRAMLSYFGVHKNQTMAQFRAAVESDQVSLVAEPYEAIRARFKMKALNSTRPTATALAAPPARNKVRREVKPYEPRFERSRTPRPPRQDRGGWTPWFNWFSPRQP